MLRRPWLPQLVFLTLLLPSIAAAAGAASATVASIPPAVSSLAATGAPGAFDVPADAWAHLSCQERREALRALAAAPGRQAETPIRLYVDGRMVASHDGRVATFFPDPSRGEPHDLQMLRDTNDPVAVDVPLSLVSMPRPEYPREARERGIQGSVALRALVGTDGRVEEIVLPTGAALPLLTEAALAAARDAVFEPARRANEPVPVWTLVPFEFVID